MKGPAFLPLAISLFGIGGLGASKALQSSPFAIINETPSMAKGLYVRGPAIQASGKTLQRGAIVALPLQGAAQAYLTGALGYPAKTLLLKRVAGFAGDQVCATANSVTVRDRSVVVLARDRQGRSLPHWLGCRVLADNEVFLLGDRPGSFDGRYLGPTSTNALIGTYRAVATW